MANYIQAVKWMYAGKKTKHGKLAHENSYYFLDELKIKLYNGYNNHTIDVPSASGCVPLDTWEIYKQQDNWNLAEARDDYYGSKISHRDHETSISTTMFKTFLRKAKEDIEANINTITNMNEPEIFKHGG